MKVLADTSCLVAAMIESHPAHERAFAWYQQVLNREYTLHLCAHTLAEVYAVLTRLPLKPRLGPAAARQMIRENIESVATVVALSGDDYAQVLNRIADLGLAGGVVYDALAVRAAQKARVARVFTLNESDFRRVWPEAAGQLASP